MVLLVQKRLSHPPAEAVEYLSRGFAGVYEKDSLSLRQSRAVRLGEGGACFAIGAWCSSQPAVAGRCDSDPPRDCRRIQQTLSEPPTEKPHNLQRDRESCSQSLTEPTLINWTPSAG
jgi:hypothetical protein